MTRKRMIIVTGLSGSGKSAVLKAFEDLGYYCVDNLPLSLVPGFTVFADHSEETLRSAIGIDVRDKRVPEDLPVLLTKLKAADHMIEMLFLEASDQTLVRRFSETRRPHPLAKGKTPLVDAIQRERDALREIKKLADRILDTSDYTVHDLRQAVERHYAKPGAPRPMVITMITFGYKFGVPFDIDLLFDLRFLPNPHFVPALKSLTGENADVSEYVLAGPESKEFLARLLGFLEYLLPRYQNEGKSYLTIGFGCTGGKHRSVAVSLYIAERFRELGYEVNIKHRDMGN